MADIIDVSIDNSTNTVGNVAKRIASIAAGVISDSFAAKGDAGLTVIQASIFSSLRIKLFLKYSMGEYEDILANINRNDELAGTQNGN
jgi:hypothetical protein